MKKLILIGPVLFAIVLTALTFIKYDFLLSLGWHPINDPTFDWPSGLALGRFGWIMTATFITSGLIMTLFAGYYQAPGITVDVRDTIGSGDAFLAGFLQQKRLGASPQHCLERACQLGAFVATQQGGTPIHPA